jgi:hypothetical protein
MHLRSGYHPFTLAIHDPSAHFSRKMRNIALKQALRVAIPDAEPYVFPRRLTPRFTVGEDANLLQTFASGFDPRQARALSNSAFVDAARLQIKSTPLLVRLVIERVRSFCYVLPYSVSAIIVSDFLQS